MKNEWRRHLSIRAPRYTSYPSVLHFDSSVSSEDYCRRLREVRVYEPLSLYVHVPFCRQLCWYCGCNMRVENSYDRALRYVEAVRDEIRLVAGCLGGRGRPSAVHFGGGTPNYLAVREIGAILETIECELGLTDSSALSIEIDPRLASEESVCDLARLGFTRMSLGVQDFDPIVQAAINRPQPYEMVEACVSAVRAAGISDLSFDLLYGLPEQTDAKFVDTLEKTIALSPDRVSVFGYAHLPSALPRQRMIDSSALPGDEDRAGLATMADDALIAAGYHRVGFDHYAKPDNTLGRALRAGRLRRNFQGFTDDVSETMLGFGASAIGFIGGLYTQNEKDIARYAAAIGKKRLPVSRGLVRTEREAIVGRAISEFLCRGETSVAEALASAPPGEANRVCARLEHFAADGVIDWDGDRIRLAPDAHLLSRAVAMALDPYAEDEKAFAKAV